MPKSTPVLDLTEYTGQIKNLAKQLGFLDCGISRAAELKTQRVMLQQWLGDGFHAEMQYMENHFEKRLDPTKLVPGAKSVISLTYNYFPKQQQLTSAGFRISKYAYGKDYHSIIKTKLQVLLKAIGELDGEVSGRAFVDSAPVLEKQWAAQAGLGWIGKNSLLTSKKSGSYFFLAELIIDRELVYDSPVNEHCGTCTKCLDACPTNALVAPRTLDSKKCISYHTIENRGLIPELLTGKFENYIFGCDICQDVCPWNKKAEPHSDPQLDPCDEVLRFTTKDWQNMDEGLFSSLFEKSPIARIGFPGLKRNIAFVEK